MQETNPIIFMILSTTHTYEVDTDTVFLLSLDILKLNYDNARCRMADYHQQARETTERAYKAIAIYATLLTLLCAYIFAHPDWTWQMLPVWLLLAGTTASTLLMMKVVMPRDYIPLGRKVGELQPNEYAKSFIKDNDGQESIDDDMQMRLLLRDELNQLEKGIDWQEEVNSRRARLFGWSLRFIFYGMPAAMLSYLILIFL